MKNSRIVQLATFAMVVFGGVGTAFADSMYSFTTINVPGALSTGVNGINDSGQIVGGFGDATGGHGFVLDVGGSFTTIDVPGKRGCGEYSIERRAVLVPSDKDSCAEKVATKDVRGRIIQGRR